MMGPLGEAYTLLSAFYITMLAFVKFLVCFQVSTPRVYATQVYRFVYALGGSVWI